MTNLIANSQSEIRTQQTGRNNMRTETNQVYSLALLENGHTVDTVDHKLKVGDEWMTPWGPRKVVEVEYLPLDDSPDDFDNGCQ